MIPIIPPFDPLEEAKQFDREFSIDQLALLAMLEHNSLQIQGHKVTYKKHSMREKRTAGVLRGKVFGMSRASRLNLLKKLAVWDWDNIGYSLFITLTYPDERALPNRAARNKHRYLFHRWLEHKIGRRVPCLWRVEYQIRQTGLHSGKPCPHWHLLLPTVRFLNKDAVNEKWRQVITWNGYARTETVSATKAEGAAMYIGKYLGKSACSNSLVYAAYHNDSGRHWGILREREIPLCKIEYIERLSDVQSEWLLKFAEQFMPSVDSKINTSFTLLGVLADDCISEFTKKCIDVL